jgi:hypothetical protein
MSMLSRGAVVVVLAVLIPLVVTTVCPGVVAALGLDLDLAGAWAQQEREDRRHQGLVEQEEQLRARVAAMDHICRDLIAGRFSLAVAATRCRTLYEPEGEYFWAALNAWQEGRTEDERLARYVIECVRRFLEKNKDPDEVRSVLLRLERELQEQRATRRGVRGGWDS